MQAGARVATGYHVPVLVERSHRLRSDARYAQTGGTATLRAVGAAYTDEDRSALDAASCVGTLPDHNGYGQLVMCSEAQAPLRETRRRFGEDPAVV